MKLICSIEEYRAITEGWLKRTKTCKFPIFCSALENISFENHQIVLSLVVERPQPLQLEEKPQILELEGLNTARVSPDKNGN